MELENLTKKERQNTGYMFYRTKYVDVIEPKTVNREKVFAEKWIKENKRRPGINFGFGILQDLFIASDKIHPFYPGRIVAKINKRDRFIVATVIQWLGSNVGFCFLQECLDMCGYRIVKKESEVRTSKAANNSTDIFSAIKTQTTTDATGFVTPFIVENYGQSKAKSILDAIGTLKTNTTMGFVSSGALNGWLTYYNGSNQGSRILNDPVGTLPTHDRVAVVVHPDKDKLTLHDVLYRTIRPHEVKKGMAFDDDYIICGNSGEQVKQLGNAVTPPVMEWLLERGIETFM